MSQSQLLKRTILEITHIRIQLRHAVGNRCSSRKGHTLAACNLIKILALGKHIGGLLRFCLCDTCHIPHFRVKEQVLVIVALIHKQPVYPQLLKGYDIIFPALVI